MPWFSHGLLKGKGRSLSVQLVCEWHENNLKYTWQNWEITEKVSKKLFAFYTEDDVEAEDIKVEEIKTEESHLMS